MTLQSFERALKQPKPSSPAWVALFSLFSLMMLSGQASAAPATFEMFAASGNTAAVGPTTVSQTHTYRYNTDNPTGNAVQTVYPQPTVTYSLENQQYTNGLVFGNANNPQNSFVALATQGAPINTDFASSRNNAANPQGIDVNNNYGLRMTLVTGRLTGVRPRDTRAVNGGLGHYYGDIVMTWSRPILNPVINLSGLGGTGGSQSTFGFSASAELFNPPAGTTISRLAGTNLQVDGLTIRNSSATIGATRTTGGASGSVQVLNANPITTLRFRLYVRSDSTATSTDWGPNTAGVGEAFVFSSSSVDAAVGDLFVSKTNDVGSVTSGSSTTYTVRVANNGPDTVDGAILSDVVGTGLTATSVACSGAAANRCTTAPSLASVIGSGVVLPSLASGQFYEVSLTANVTATFGSVTNSARVALSATSTSALTGASCVTSGGITRSFNTLTGVCSSTDTDNVVVLSTALQCQSNMYALQGNTTAGFRNIVPLSPDGAVGAPVATVPTNGNGTGDNNNAGLAISPDGTKIFVTTPQNRLRVYDVPTSTWVADVAVPSGDRGIRATVTSNGIGYIGSGNQLWTFQINSPYTVSGPVTITPQAGAPVLTNTNGDFFADDSGNLFLSANPTNNGTTLNLYQVAANGRALYLGTVNSPNGQYGGYAALTSGIYASAVSGVILRADLINLLATQTAAADPTRGNSDLASCFYPNLRPILQVLKTSTKVAGSAGAQIIAGDTVEYRIVIRNIGTLSAAGVQFQDSIPAGTTYVAGSTTYNYTTATGRPQVALADVGGVMPFVTARAVGSPTAAAGVLLVDQTGAGTMATDAAQRDREVVITFRVTVNANASVVSNRGFASYISDPGPPTTTTVGTDDPTTPEPNDATVTTITQNADLSITKTNNVTNVSPSSATSYTVVVTNAGPSAANGALFRDAAATGLNKTSITCTASGGAVCPTAPIDITVVEGTNGIAIPTLPSAGSLTFVVNADVTAANGASITNTATITAPAGVNEINAANNTASDTDTVTAAPVAPPTGGQATDQCSAANALPVVASQTNTSTFSADNDASTTITVDNTATAQTYFGTGPNGAIEIPIQLGWSYDNVVLVLGTRSQATLSIRINGTTYARLVTTAPTNSTTGTIFADNGAAVSIGGGAFSTTSVNITGSATSGDSNSNNVLRNVVIRLPTSISAVSSMQLNYDDAGTNGDDISYRIGAINQCKNRVTLIKAISGSRVANNDQFAMTIAGSNGPATTTTTGSGSTVINGSTTLYKVRGNTTYTLSEAMAAGSGSSLSSYNTSYTCTNASTGTGTVLPSATSGQSFTLTPRAGDDITCTMTNANPNPIDQTGVATDQCSVDNALNVLIPIGLRTRDENMQTINTTIPVNDTTSGQTYFGTGINGRIQVAAQLGWSHGQPSIQRTSSTLSIEVDGTIYATLNTRPSGTVTSSVNGTITALNGAEVSINGGAFASSVTIVGSNSGGQSANPDVLRNVVVRLPASISAVPNMRVIFVGGDNDSGDDISHNIQTVNQCKNRITLVKSLVGNRVANNDQFAMTIAGQNGPATTTTTGSGSTVTTGATTLYKVRGNTSYNLSELMAAGSGSTLSSYNTSYSCTNASTGTTTVLPAVNSTGSSFTLTPQAGDDLTCTMINTKDEPANRPVYQCDSNPANTVFHETFGVGTAPGRRLADLPAGATTYPRNSSANTITQANDGEYDIVTNPDFVDDYGVNVWHNGLDHTGNQYGYMGLFNATNQVSNTFFYRSNIITGLQPNTRYRFKGWATNLATSRIPGTVETPNITLSILDATNNAVISTINTGDIAQTSPDDVLVWNEYGVEFMTGPSQTSAVVQLSNNKPGGNGNDLAIDDLCLVRVTTDLAVTKTNNTTIVDAGGETTYVVEVVNAGAVTVNGAVLQDPNVMTLPKTEVTCEASNGAICPTITAPTDIEAGLTIPTLPAGGKLTFLVVVNINAMSGSVTNTATITAPLGLTDIDPANNSASDTDTVNALVIVSGRVFNDNSGTTNMAANAYNGSQDAGESGLAGSAVQLNNCSGTVIATTQTNGIGDYAFSVPAGSLSTPNFCITQTNLAGYTSVSGTDVYVRATDTITTSNMGLLSYANRNFGDARLALVLTTDGQQTTTPSGTVSYSHILRSESALMVGAINTASTEAPLFGWTTVLYRDTNCNGTVEESDPVLTSAIGQLLPNQEICVVQRVNAPANASNGAQHVATLSASYTATVQGGDVLSGSSNTRTDTTLVGTAGLDLRKQVRVVASCPSTGADVAAFTERNTAKNGEFLEYQIIYSNRSTRNLSQLTVRDVAPNNTTFQSATCQSTPSGSSCSAPVSAGVNGDLAWSLSNIAPAATGSVRFCVRVPPLAEPPIQ